MKAEDFVKNHFKGIEDDTYYPAIVAIAEGFAEQQAKEFAEWIIKQHYSFHDDTSDGIIYVTRKNGYNEYSTIDKLYKKWKEESQ